MKQLIPPVALPLVQSVVRLGRRPEWQYLPSGWRANHPGGGWHHPSVVAAQRRRWSAFVAAIRSTGALGVKHEDVRIETGDLFAQNAILAFAYVLARNGVAQNRVSLLDWGGGLGYYAVIARAVLPELILEYTVKDLPEICEAGRALLPGVQFTSDEEACLSQRYDLVFASNSLQYTEDWRRLLARFARAAQRWVFLTRLPLVETTKAFVVVQRPHWVGYHTEYVSWVFNRHELLDHAAAEGLVLEREFLMAAGSWRIAGAPEPLVERGFLFRAPDNPLGPDRPLAGG